MKSLLSIAGICLLFRGVDSAFVSLAHSIRSAVNHRRITTRQRATYTDEFDSIELGKARLSHHFSFPLDDWQLQAGGEVCKGHNVIVCAPTGAGKTVVGEMAVHIARETGLNSIYTTPLKALSNQKFVELRQIFGKSSVGLSTGDMSINRGAQVSVMTTEVYRNMAWRSSAIQDGALVLDDELASNAVVVLDEFHYMGQPGRGGVWEECVITSPAHTQLVGLSATLPNALELAKWMESVTGRKTVLVEARGGRPVPLRYLFATKKGLYPLFKDPDAGPGSPKGMLGYRGDGLVPPGKTNKKTGFGATEQDAAKDELPKGLHVNPILKASSEKRLQAINDAIDRLKLQSISSDNDRSQRSSARERWVKRGPMTARDELRERDRLLKKELRKAVPSLAILLQRLKQKDLLPAILFIFSRAGCDEAATSVCQQMKGGSEESASTDVEFDSYSEQEQNEGDGRKRGTRKRSRRSQERLMNDSEGRTFRKSSNYVDDDTLASFFDDSVRGSDVEFDDSSPLSQKNWEFCSYKGLLSYDEVRQVANRVSDFNEANKEIAFDDGTVEEFLFGVGSHHAGMLAAHKAFVEKLYRDQLMKVVFATETLAAGINMPARTTCICAMAKRGESSSMNLLETSNLLQMAGRAGRRGMDTDGTCVLVATPFEGHDEAALILTSEIKPINSQFSPSYTLAVNLLARGAGKLDIAQQLVQKSFAMWQKRQVEKSDVSVVKEEVMEGLAAASHGQFMKVVADSFQEKIEQSNSNFDLTYLQLMLEILDDRKKLRKASRSFIGLTEQLEMQKQIMTYLEQEKIDLRFASTEEDNVLQDLFNEDMSDIEMQKDAQKTRILSVTTEISKHPFYIMAAYINKIANEMSSRSQFLTDSLDNARNSLDPRPIKGTPLVPEELTVFAKSFITTTKKKRNLLSSMGDNEFIDKATDDRLIRDSTWNDMLSLTKVLVSYGCLTTTCGWNLNKDDDDALEVETFEITAAGTNIGMLAFDNTLWALVGMGGAWDVVGASAQLDVFRDKMKAFGSRDDDWDEYDDVHDLPSSQTEAIEAATIDTSIAQKEAEVLIDCLRELTPFELAGYVACLVSEGGRRNGPSSVIESFQRFSPAQQRAIQASLATAERLVEVQKQCGVEESQSRCELELSTCEVVTAWAGGCSWSDALLISGAAPGDLARMLGRVLDALRQYSKLHFTPVRANIGQKTVVSPGIHPEVRRLCLEAAKSINRYPVKDPLPFDTDDDDDISDNLDLDEEDENIYSGEMSEIS